MNKRDLLAKQLDKKGNQLILALFWQQPMQSRMEPAMKALNFKRERESAATHGTCIAMKALNFKRGKTLYIVLPRSH